MSFFDQHYYALNKGHMSLIGIWPEQSKYVRNIWPLTIFVIVLTLVAPGGDLDAVIYAVPTLLTVPVNFTIVLNSILKIDKVPGNKISKPLYGQAMNHFLDSFGNNSCLILFLEIMMKVLLKKMETHWKMFKNTSAVIVLDKYAERGRFLTTMYSKYAYISLVFYFSIPIVPIILDFVDPLNETRPKDYIYDVEYGVDPDQYFWLILIHGYVVTILSISIFVAFDTIYIMWVEHACALFEVVGFKLKMANAEYVAGRKNAVTIHDDCNYKKICDCIILHNEALSFAGMIENIYSGSMVVVISFGTIVMSITGLQAIIHIKHPKIMLRTVQFAVGQAFHLYFNNMPGQRLIDHSLRVHNFAYDIDWYNMPLKVQKLLILILKRSRTPCFLTAGKTYVLSMESYGTAMETAISYFVIFLQLY